MSETKNQVPAVKELTVALPESVKTIEFNGVVCNNDEDKKKAIAAYVVNKILRQFGMQEIAKTPILAGGIYFNNGNKQKLSLTAVKTRPDGGFAETPKEYFLRNMKEIDQWIVRATQMADFTSENVGELFGLMK